MIENIGAYSQVDYDRGYQQGRADVIDEFMERIQSLEHYKYYTENNVMDILYFGEDIKQIAEQLKSQN